MANAERGGDAGGALRRHRPRALVVGADLPERERTKHVHRLHPYLGKFVPQLVEALLDRYVRPGGRVLDPFGGSGTTLVQALESGYDAVGVDVAAFNALLMSVKTREYDLRRSRATCATCKRLGRVRRSSRPARREWFAPPAASELLHFSLTRGFGSGRAPRGRRARGPLGAAHDALRPGLPARAAGGRVLVLQAPAHVPAGGDGATSSSPATCWTRLARIRAFDGVRDPARRGAARRRARGRARRAVRRCRHLAAVSGADRLPRAASLRLRAPGARRPSRAGGGRAARGTSGRRSPSTWTGSRRSCAVASGARRGAPVCIVVNDRRDLYPEILGVPGCASRIGSSGTSTAAPAAAQASTSSRSSSVADA